MSNVVAGYTYDQTLPPSPVQRADLAQLLTDVMWTEADAAALRRAGEILRPHVSEVQDVFYDFIGGTPHLVDAFVGPDGEPDSDYLAAVRGRFGQWVIDLCTRDFDERWLAYQEEIGLRHHSTKKNRTDAVDSPRTHVPLRHITALIVPVTLTIRDLLAAHESDTAEVDAMQQAWFKAVTVSLVLWSRPFAGDLW
ncbi:protoglobin domain-containing protein [Mycobacterium kyorinense]|uniref:Protogloblin ApPgb n=1 Tax=Mycobacterium kyorinense TaxID=487514 RepID=A0A1X1Y9T6_9MYCO|nr:protoglobin domain-containing protein [Mycobacterium kyorinense]ORW07839.1 protogloblin ApPgb [Mycobacterium kyorinense]